MALIGPGGIGKTAIAAKVLEHLTGDSVQHGTISLELAGSYLNEWAVEGAARVLGTVHPDQQVANPKLQEYTE